MVNRGASRDAMDKLEAFYVDSLGQTLSYSYGNSSSDLEQKCFLWKGATVPVCYTWRPDSSTKGDFKVKDFEDMLNTVHKNLLLGQPMCGVDKWFDNHYAIDSMSADASKIVTYVNDNYKTTPYYCSSMGPQGASLHYVFDPCGWGIQLDLNMQSAGTPQGCSSSSVSSTPAFVGSSAHDNPACSPGTCSTTPPPTPATPGSPTPPPSPDDSGNKSWLSSHWYILVGGAVVVLALVGVCCYCRKTDKGDLSDQMGNDNRYESLENGQTKNQGPA